MIHSRVPTIGRVERTTWRTPEKMMGIKADWHDPNIAVTQQIGVLSNEATLW